jgi:hypothetical protein
MENYSNLIEAIEGLRKQGYTTDFNLMQNCLECSEKKYKLYHHEFVVDKYFRFEADTNPDEQSIIYAISSETQNVKGILINAYGIYSDPVTDEMLQHLKIN